MENGKKRNDMASFLFHQGTNYRSYQYLGVHREDDGFVFRLWAPNAASVFLVGDFNGWELSDGMERITKEGLWEIRISASVIPVGSLYKYAIKTRDGRTLYKADPYGYSMQRPPETASVVYELGGYSWHDEGFLSYRKNHLSEKPENQPINIYEVHLGSWKKREDGSYLSYRELADDLVVYVKQMGYTHIELMPVMEHPFDGSWGYQVCGYYAPTARFGTPHDFMYFVDVMHEAGIGVIMDWVPAHFPKDAHGLYEFDGGLLYEYQGADRMEHHGWGTRCFDVGRNEVECFLISNAAFWADVYHIDGLRVDAVASMLYLDYDRKPGEWIPNVYGDNKNLEAISFFKSLNGFMKKSYPDVLMIAEESTAFSNVTRFGDGGLGFTFKWNMGWMNDVLSYQSEDPLFRKYHHDKMTFSLTYAFSEKYILPISHDEVVHGKKSLLDRMPGEYVQKFANNRAFALYMMTHPGKKLMFMGSEIGQFREWDFEGQIEWFLLDYDAHAKLQYFFAELNHFYLEHPALYEKDGSWDGFSWIEPNDRDQSVYSYSRIDEKGNELVVIINFTPVSYPSFRLWVPKAGVYREVFNTDSALFGGGNDVNSSLLPTDKKDQHIEISLSGMTGCVFMLDSNRTEKSDDTHKTSKS